MTDNELTYRLARQAFTLAVASTFVSFLTTGFNVFMLGAALRWW